MSIYIALRPRSARGEYLINDLHVPKLIFTTPKHTRTLVRYPSVKNSEGVVLWTHEIGSGLVVAPDAENRQETSDDADAGSGNGAGNGAGVEVR